MILFTLLTVWLRLSSFVTQLILARILAPEYFGVLGLAMTVTAIASSILTLGLDDVLVGKPEVLALSGRRIEAVLAMVSAVFVTSILLSSRFVARVYQQDSLQPVLCVAALALIPQAIFVVPNAILRARLKFKTITLLAAIEATVVAVGSVAFAFGGFGALSFVLPLPVAAWIKAAAAWYLAPPSGSKFLIAEFIRLFKAGSYVLAHRVVVTAIGQADYIALGLFATASEVGLYLFAFRLSIQPIAILSGNLTNVLFPLISSLRDVPDRQRGIVIRIMPILNYIVFPACAAQAMLASTFIPIVFGQKWSPAIFLTIVLTLGMSVEAAAWQAGVLLNSRGDFKLTFIYTVWPAPLFFFLVFLAAPTGGANAVALAVAIYYICFSIIFTYLVLRLEGILLLQVLLIYGRPLVVSAVTSLVCFLLYLFLCTIWTSIVAVLLSATVSPAVYTLAFFMIARDDFIVIRDSLLSPLARLLMNVVQRRVRRQHL